MAQYTVLANTTIVETTEDLEEAIRVAKAVWEKNADEVHQSGGDANVDCYVVIMDEQGREVWYDQKDYTEEDGKTHYEKPKRKSWWEDYLYAKDVKSDKKGFDKSNAEDVEYESMDDEHYSFSDEEMDMFDSIDAELESKRGPFIWAVAPIEVYTDGYDEGDDYFEESEYEYDDMTECFEDGLEEGVKFAQGETEEACRLDIINIGTGDVVESVIVQSDGEYY